MISFRVLTFLLLALAACTGEREIVLRDVPEALVCLDDVGGLRVRVNFGDCRAGGCVSVVDLACAATVEERVIDVTASALLFSSGESTCTRDCRPVVADCDPLSLEDGAYELRYAGRSHQIELPLGAPTAPSPTFACDGAVVLEAP